MNKEMREHVREMALTTKHHMDLLITTLDYVDQLELDKLQQNALIAQYAEDIEAAQARIGEDEQTILFKDNQLAEADRQLKSWEEGWTKQKSMLSEKEEIIQGLRNENANLKKELTGETETVVVTQ